MFRRVITSIRHLNHHTTGFDSYISDIQKHTDISGPTMDEAKKDFRSAIHMRNTGFLG